MTILVCTSLHMCTSYYVSGKFLEVELLGIMVNTLEILNAIAKFSIIKLLYQFILPKTLANFLKNIVLL